MCSSAFRVSGSPGQELRGPVSKLENFIKIHAGIWISNSISPPHTNKQTDRQTDKQIKVDSGLIGNVTFINQLPSL